MADSTWSIVVAVLVVVAAATAMKTARSVKGFLGVLLAFGVVIGLVVQAANS